MPLFSFQPVIAPCSYIIRRSACLLNDERSCAFRTCRQWRKFLRHSPQILCSPPERLVTGSEVFGTLMASISKFVCGGGFVERQRFGRPNLRRFTLLAFGWSVISGIALWMMLLELSDGLTCGVLILPQPIFAVIALVCRFNEKPCSWTERTPNPDYDARKLY